MNVVRKEDTYTIDDIYALPDGERAELIDGQIYYMAPPNTKNQRLVHFFDRKIVIIFRVTMAPAKSFQPLLRYS